MQVAVRHNAKQVLMVMAMHSFEHIKIEGRKCHNSKIAKLVRKITRENITTLPIFEI